MKIIDLLNKIANGEEVPKFKYRDILFEYNKEYRELMSKQKFIRSSDVFEYYFLFEEIDMTNLNDEVEILEEPKKDKIEKLDDNFSYRLKMKDILWNDNEVIIVNKINEIIEVINEK